MPPRVSVNVCCYNAERYLEATLQSIFAQTFTDWELVIVDDGSSDGTGAIIRRHVEAGRPIVHHTQANAGLSASRNEALRRSTGALIAFLDHDDLWEPAKLEKQVPLFDRDPGVGVVYADCVNFSEDGRSHRQFEQHPPRRGFVFGALLRDYFPNLQTVVVRRDALDGLPEWFDTRLGLAEEADLLMRLARRWEFDYVNEPLARWRLHAASTSRTSRERFTDEMELLLANQLRDPSVERDYASEIDAFRLQILRLRARVLWEQGRGGDAARLLTGSRFASPAAFRDYLLMRTLSPGAAERLRRVRRWFGAATETRTLC